MSKLSLAQLSPTHFAPQRAPLRRANAPTSATGGGIWNFFKAVREVPEELRRMADEYETTRPELSMRLRRMARQGWGW